jgi:hypothetical protein
VEGAKRTCKRDPIYAQSYREYIHGTTGHGVFIAEICQGFRYAHGEATAQVTSEVQEVALSKAFDPPSLAAYTVKL